MPDDLGARIVAALEFPKTASRLAEDLGANGSTVNYTLKNLVNVGRVEARGVDTHGGRSGRPARLYARV
jgi:predicted ArsR family transcriptional regulator